MRCFAYDALRARDRDPSVPPDNADTWLLLHHDLMSPVTIILGTTQLLQRRLLRADGLSTLERDWMLGNLVTTMTAIHELTARVNGLLPDEPRPPAD